MVHVIHKRGFNYSLCSNVTMLKPSVGEMVFISSPLNFFKIVVLPALSKPLQISKDKGLVW